MTAFAGAGRCIAAASILLCAYSCGGGTKDAGPTTPTPVLTTVVVTLSTTTLQAGLTATAAATGLDQFGAPIAVGAVSWSSTSAGVATVNASGTVTGVAPGQTQIIASAGSKQGQATLTVGPAPMYALTLTTTGTGGGTVSASPTGPTYVAGTQVTVTATANTGSTFTGWSGACSGTGACTVTMDANKSVTAGFALVQTFTLTLGTTGSGSGTVSASPPGPTYPAGTIVTLTAAARAGSTFAGWSGACTGASCVVTMDANKSVTATFAVAAGSNLYSGSGSVTYATARSTDGCAWNTTDPVRVDLVLTIQADGSVSGTAHITGAETNQVTAGACAAEPPAPFDVTVNVTGTTSGMSWTASLFPASDYDTVGSWSASLANGVITVMERMSYTGPGASGLGSVTFTLR
ncbi:MAG TPA: Ig-like domain-containing protein [Gemmatimonadaceae bacterium]|nr:Ig-like domain-containing protein [Gemmatimonadaceae bacterium]